MTSEAACKLCKEGLEGKIDAACRKARWAFGAAFSLLAAVLALSGIAWSARSDVSNQKELLVEVRKEQKQMAEDLNRIAEFVDLLKKGKIVVKKSEE